MLAQGGVRDAALHVRREVLTQQRHGPLDRRVAQRIRRLVQAPRQEQPQGFGPHRRTSSALTIMERRRRAVALVPLDPVIERLPGDAERGRNLRQGSTLVDLQQREDALERSDVLGGLELSLKLPPLPCGQSKFGHDGPTCWSPAASRDEPLPHGARVSKKFLGPT